MTALEHRPLRVLTLVDGTHGGAESMARQITANLDQSRFEPIFCVSRWEPPEEGDHGLEELRETGVDLLRLERKSRTDLRAWRRLVAYIREHRVDVLHTHKVGSNVWGALLRAPAKVPVFVAHEHGWSFQGEPLRRFLDRQLIARRADAFIAVSKEDQRRMHEVEGIPLDKTRFISNGIPIPPSPDPRAVRSELGLDPAQPAIGAVATLWPEKALDVLIKAAALLRGRFPGLSVLLAGGEGAGSEGSYSPERERLAAVARELDIAEGVHFLGRRSDVPNVLAALDVAVLSSNSEGSPLAVMEYMEAGKPVVATRVGGLPDLIEDGVTGSLVEPQDPEGLARAIGEILCDPKRAEEMGRAGRDRCRREFSIQHTARQVEDLYEELYAANVGRSARR